MVSTTVQNSWVRGLEEHQLNCLNYKDNLGTSVGNAASLLCLAQGVQPWQLFKICGLQHPEFNSQHAWLGNFGS